jgi:lipopolysaccharide transport system ATP-binding protein
MSTEGIVLKDVTLTYDLYYDKTQTLKEFLINSMHSRSYVKKKKEQINALNGISLKIAHGERLGVIGHNGAGKSSLLKVIAGILKPTKGMVHVSGSVQPLIEVAAGFNFEFSGRENIYLNGYMLGFSRSQIRAKEKEIIEFADLGQFIDVPVKYYSTGMQVRLAFTIATSVDPEYLIFDEMLSAGDAAFMEKARHRMDSLLKRAKILVVVSHDLETIRNFCTRAIVMEKGNIVFEGSTHDAIAYYVQHLTKSTTDEPNPPLVMGDLQSRHASTGYEVLCSLFSEFAVQGKAFLEVYGQGQETLVQSEYPFALSSNQEGTLNIGLENLAKYRGQFQARLKLDYVTSNGVEHTVSSDCSIKVENPSDLPVKAIWGLQVPAQSNTDIM